MNCVACQQLLAEALDATTPVDQAAFAEHLRDCADCREYHAAAQRLHGGLNLLRPMAPPAGLSNRIVAAVQDDQRRRRRRTRLRFAVGFAAAAAVLIALAIFFRPMQNEQPPVAENNEPRPPIQTPEKQPDAVAVSPRQTVETAVDAVASLAAATTSRTVEQTKKLVPLVEPPFSDLALAPPISAPTALLSLRETGQGVSEGLKPVADHAQRAVDLLRRELPDF